MVIRQKLLETLGSEPERVVRNKISDAVAEVARQYTENSQCPTHSFGPYIAVANHIPEQRIAGLNFLALSSS
jgi:importin-5